MNVIPTPIEGCVILERNLYRDHRGFFMEAWHQDKLAEQGFQHQFVQDNVSYSEPRVLRGLHYQWPNPQGKLVQCLQGEIWDVCVDIRAGSPTFGQHFGLLISLERGNALYVPEGCLHGFVVTEGPAVVAYKVTAPFSARDDRGVHYLDPELNVPWPEVGEMIVSEKDANLPLLKDIEEPGRP
ncbi:dTDP-4-dehydrorhamnose 3,5-epimerase [Geitlerinema splendidum]|nr:dTDP-4-dehydrorhamnose 3,5-epimerase [Geitlerinema splendidum]